MSLTLYFNPQSRALTIRWLLEEIGVPYELKPVEYDDGSMRSPEFLALNPMGKIPVLVDDGIVVTEAVAIALYLGDKHKTPNDLAPAIGDPLRGPYLRWLIYYANIEAAMMQKAAGFEMEPRMAGWGSYDLVVEVMQDLVARADPWILGRTFTAVDVVLGGGINYGMMVDLFPKLPEFTAYCERLMDRPAQHRASGDA